MSLIYEPGFPAREYAPLGLNIYKGCTHGCLYCYGPSAVHEKSEQYFSDPDPKKDFIQRLKEEIASSEKKIEGEILVSFVGDPYQPEDDKLRLTRETLEVLRKNDLTFTVLTKGGMRAERDFDILEDYPKSRFGSTITSLNKKYVSSWEPYAADISSRIHAIEIAKALGIPTWLSLEPVIEPVDALEVIKYLYPIIDHFKVGRIDHFKTLREKQDWVSFRNDVIALLDSLHADYYIKNSLMNAV